MDALFQGTKVTVRNLLSLINRRFARSKELVATPVKVRLQTGYGELLVQEILPSPHLVYFQNSLTFSGTPRCKGVSAANKAREELRLLREKLSSKGVRVSEQKKEAKKI